ncbi:MAG: Gfo/Idh/MocA family oxidoreductase, partial [Gammaproteobacteria bacterium]|nr:Gfo/Idh/MocA family oxidoreductase [Gammaproteobacteria bacterium]
MSEPLKAAVIGVGYLGYFHCQKYQALEGVELVGIADSDPGRLAEVAAKLGDVTAVADYRELLPQLDVVSIVTPPDSHFTIAGDCLAAGLHVLVEKPVTSTVDEAQTLIEAARAAGLIFQVGHLERFNPAVAALRREVHAPDYIEARRTSPQKQRGLEVDVVLDLMIHDIDIICSLVGAEVREIEATGSCVATVDIDIADARLTFDGGCVAELHASRVAEQADRRTYVHQADSYVTVDYMHHTLVTGALGAGGERHEHDEVCFENPDAESRDALKAEIRGFLAAVANRASPLVTGEDGRR